MEYLRLRNTKEENSDNSNVLITQKTEVIENFDGLIEKKQLGEHTIMKPYYVIFRHSHVLLEKLVQALERVKREKKWVVI